MPSETDFERGAKAMQERIAQYCDDAAQMQEEGAASVPWWQPFRRKRMTAIAWTWDRAAFRARTLPLPAEPPRFNANTPADVDLGQLREILPLLSTDPKEDRDDGRPSHAEDRE